MARRTIVAALALTLGGWVCLAWGQDVAPGRARIIWGDGARALQTQTHWTSPCGSAPVGVVLRQVAHGAVTMDRALAESPTRPYLIEVRINQTTVYLDPNKDYLRQGPHLIDSDQYIPRAQRLWHTLVRSRAQLILPGDRQEVETRSTKLPVPRAIFLKPQADPKVVPAPGEPAAQPKASEKLAAAR